MLFLKKEEDYNYKMLLLLMKERTIIQSCIIVTMIFHSFAHKYNLINIVSLELMSSQEGIVREYLGERQHGVRERRFM